MSYGNKIIIAVIRENEHQDNKDLNKDVILDITCRFVCLFCELNISGQHASIKYVQFTVENKPVGFPNFHFLFDATKQNEYEKRRTKC
jgi:hypothetical protein